jgi:hypothetical protein
MIYSPNISSQLQGTYKCDTEFATEITGIKLLVFTHKHF